MSKALAHKGVHLVHKEKRKLSQAEEFEIMKLVLDKFLWIAAAFLFLGLYFFLREPWPPTLKGLPYVIVGALIGLVFVWIIVKEFERIR